MGRDVRGGSVVVRNGPSERALGGLDRCSVLHSRERVKNPTRGNNNPTRVKTTLWVATNGQQKRVNVRMALWLYTANLSLIHTIFE